MEPFEYIVVLISLILGLGLAQILTNVADIVSNLKNVKIGYSHSLLVFVVFMTNIQDWWYTYQYFEEIQVWTLQIVLFLLIYPVLLLMLARMLFPTGWRGHETDLEDYYYDQWRVLFSVYAITAIVSLAQNMLISGYPIESQILIIVYIVWLLVFVIFNIKEKWAHQLFLTLQALIWIGLLVFDNEAIKPIGT